MAAYYPLDDDEIKEGPSGPPGVGFKLTNDGNYDMEGKILRNLLDPQEETDAVTKNYTDLIHGDLKDKILVLTDNSMIHGEEYFNAKEKYIKHLGPPREESDAVTKKYVDDIKSKCLFRNNGYYNLKNKYYIRNLPTPVEESDVATKNYVDVNSLVSDENRFDAKNKLISNVQAPLDKNDAVNRAHLEYYCILWDKDKKIYYAHDERISNVKAPLHDTDCANKYYVDAKTFCATTDRLVEFTGVGFKSFQFDKTTSKLLDSNLKLSQNMYMKITIFIACDTMNENPRIRLEKMKDVLLDKPISVNKESITMFAYGKLSETLVLSVLSEGNCKMKPYIHIEKLEF